MRLVNKDGDVIWFTTQESLGAKFRGASADVAEKITAKLKEDFERARKLRWSYLHRATISVMSSCWSRGLNLRTSSKMAFTNASGGRLR